MGTKDIKPEKKVIKCQMCKKRDAITTATRPYSDEVIEVCGKCFNDMIDEEDE